MLNTYLPSNQSSKLVSGPRTKFGKHNLTHLILLFAAALLGTILVPAFANLENAHACTIGAGMGNATADGCPFAWKNRDDSSRPIHYLIYWGSGPHNYIAMGPSSSDKKMGLNDQGLALSNALITNDWFDNWDYSYNQEFKDYVLANCANISDVRFAIQKVTGGTANYWMQPLLLIGAFSDAQGKADLFELAGSAYYEYDPDSQVRRSKYPYQFVVRDNDAHELSTQLDDPYSGGSRYDRAKALMENFASNGGITTANVFSIARDGTAGSSSEINNNTTCAGLVSHGVPYGTDPRLVTMWVALGNPAFTVYLPHWVAVGNSVSARVSIASANDPTSTVGWVSEQLFKKRGSDSTYAQYVHGLLDPLEVNFLEMETLARSNWLQNGFQASEALRIQQKAAEVAYQTMNVMRNGTGKNLDVPPKISSVTAVIQGTAMQLTCNAQDSDGTIAHTEWDFGDGTTGTGAIVNHQYGTGTFLVFCKVTDNAGAQNIRALYVGTATESTVCLGDTDENKLRNISDVMLILNHIVGNNHLVGNALIAADVDKNGIVNISDAVQLMNFIVGTISLPPCI